MRKAAALARAEADALDQIVDQQNAQIRPSTAPKTSRYRSAPPS
jgi:hypothetical protein